MAVSMKFYHIAPVLGVILLGSVAFAEENSPLDAVYACAEIPDDMARLACFDTAVAGTKSAQETGEFVTITRDEAEEVQKDAFGFSLPSLPKVTLPGLGRNKDGIKRDNEGQIAELELPIKAISTDGYGKVMVTFENGQVWIQTDSERVRPSKKRPPVSATVKRKSLGSFLIRLNTGERFKAKRVQ